MRKYVKRIFVVLAIAFLAVGPSRMAGTQPTPPNILLIVTDDQRWDTVSVMPAVSLLSQAGLTFLHSFTSTSLCCPDRATLLSGLYARHHGIQGNGGVLDPDFDHSNPDLLPSKLQGVGYKTAMVGKYMVNTGNFRPPAWDAWRVFTQNGGDGSARLYFDYNLNEDGTVVSYGHDEEDYSTDVLRDHVLGLIDEWSGDGPWYIQFDPFAPHTPAIPAPRHAGMFAGIAPWRPPSWKEPDISDKPNYISFWAAVNVNAQAGTDQRRINQLESLQAVDEAVASFVTALDAAGQLENTLIIFTADNGFMWLEHWLSLKNYPYEESLRVPLILHWPDGISNPRTTGQVLVQSVDVYPTILQVAGASSPPGRDGMSLVPLFAGSSGCTWRKEIFFEHTGAASGSEHVGVRSKQWKYIKYTDGFRELYDLQNDPYELENVYDAQPEVVADMEARLQTYLD